MLLVLLYTKYKTQNTKKNTKKMTKQNKAYEMFIAGYSYSHIAKELNISKSTAHNYVKELKLLKSVQDSSSKGYSVRSEQKLSKDIVKRDSANKSTKTDLIKEFTGDDLLKKEFISYEFSGKFLELIGKPSKPFSAIIWGMPKGGKSNLSIRLADYLNEYFGSVCYIAAEEGESVTLQMKIKDIGGSSVTFVELKDKDKIRSYLKSKNYAFVFIDSINNAEIDHEFLELIKSENNLTSFIAIVQATKSGNFKGDQALTHNCDFIIKVIAGIAYHEGRFNTSSEISIFESPLYEKNPLKILPISPEKIVKSKTEPVDVLSGLIQKNEIVPTTPFDWDKLMQSITEKNIPKQSIKPIVISTTPVDTTVEKWVYGGFIVINIVGMICNYKKKDDKKEDKII